MELRIQFAKKFLGLAILLLSFQGFAQDVTGSWKGSLNVQGAEVPLVFNIEGTEGQYTATMDSPSQGATGIPMDETLLSENELTIVFKQAGIKYVAQLEGNKLNGTFYQAGMEFPLAMEKSEITIPGNPELVTSDEELDKMANLDTGDYKYSVEDYFARPKASSFQFSPDGTYMSYREKDENLKRHVYVRNLATGEVKQAIEEKEELIRGYGWINNERIAYLMDQGGDENYHVYAVNIDGTDQIDLTPFDGVQAQFSDLLKEDKDHIIVNLNKNNPQVFEPYKV
ncbi:MAG: S9 family peptidase, partial [Eudoraea sp.]|nr:S9 family peptidase [Eudoraea sp.]